MEQALSQGLHEMCLTIHHFRQEWVWWWNVLLDRQLLNKWFLDRWFWDRWLLNGWLLTGGGI